MGIIAHGANEEYKWTDVDDIDFKGVGETKTAFVQFTNIALYLVGIFNQDINDFSSSLYINFLLFLIMIKFQLFRLSI